MAAQPRGRPVQPSLARRPKSTGQRSAHSRSSRSAGASSRPISVSEYSTRAGEPSRTSRSTMPRASSSFIRSDSSRSDRFGTALPISEKRMEPPSSST